MKNIVLNFKSNETFIKEGEDYKIIENYPHYLINKYGVIKRISDHIIDCNGKSFYRKGRILKTKKNKSGYISVTLTEKGKQKGFFIHTLLAKAFIPNPNNYPIVNHIDKNPSNNSLENLEWCNYSYNAKHSLEEIKTAHNKEKIIIYRIDIKNKEIKEYFGIREAARLNNVNHSNIRSAIKNKRTVGGYYWSDNKNINFDDYDFKNIYAEKYPNRGIYKINIKNKNDIKYFRTLLNAMIDANVKSKSTIKRHLDNNIPLKGYIYISKNKFLNDYKI